MKYALSFILAALFTLAPTVQAADLHRFYSEKNGGHFYTQSTGEKQALTLNNEWKYEGVAYTVSDKEDDIPVHRFWSQKLKRHFYTASQEEKDFIIANDSNWTYEGESFRVRAYGKAVYRFYSEKNESHFYTSSDTEKENIEKNDPDWAYEGIGWFVGEEDKYYPQSPIIQKVSEMKEQSAQVAHKCPIGLNTNNTSSGNNVSRDDKKDCFTRIPHSQSD